MVLIGRLIAGLDPYFNLDAPFSEPYNLLDFKCECSSVVERQLPKLNVAGSNPATRLAAFMVMINDLQMINGTVKRDFPRWTIYW